MMDTRNRHRASIGAIILVLILAWAASAVSGCASVSASASPLKLVDSDNGKAFTVKTGDNIEVLLAGNATTGYSWVTALTEQDAALLAASGDPVYQDSTNTSVVGAGGTFAFTFKAAKAGHATLKLVYERPWEKAAPSRTFQVTITIL